MSVPITLSSGFVEVVKVFIETDTVMILLMVE
jgi:hypothetical protein